MAIIRVIKDKNNPYIMLNKACIKDNRLSWKAKGLHTYLLSLPDEWKIYVADLKNRSIDGKDSTSKGIEELEKLGYIKRNKTRNEKGQFKGYEYEVYEYPIQEDKPDAENRNGETDAENPQRENRNGETDAENPSLISNKEVSNEKVNNKENNKLTNKEDAKSVVRYVEKTLGIIGPNNTIELLSFLEDGVEEEVIIRAIDLAVGNGKRNYNYVKGILNNWLSEGIKNSAQLTEHLNNIKNKKTSTNSIHENTGKYNTGVNKNGKYADLAESKSLDTGFKEEMDRSFEECGIDWSKY